MGRAAGAAAARAVAEAGPPRRRARAGSQVRERGAQLGLGDADLLREVGERGLVDAAIGAGLERVEGGADLGRVDAELGREGLVEALDPVAAALAADDLAVAVELLERGLDLGLVETELGGQRLGERGRGARPWRRRGRDAGPRARRAAWPRSRRACPAMPERSRGPGPCGPGRARGGSGVAAGERGPVARLAPERVGPGGEHERAAECDRRLLCARGHAESFGERRESCVRVVLRRLTGLSSTLGP